MTRRSTVRFLAVSLVLLPLVAFGLQFALFLRSPVTPPIYKIVAIPSGASFAEVARRLHDKGVVGNTIDFKLLARLRGDARRIKAGQYSFSESATPGSVLDRLVAGDVRLQRLTIPEGFTLREIAARIENQKLGRAETFLRLAKDPKFIASLGFKGASLEGYLFPETYLIEYSTSEERLIREMVRQFRNRLAPAMTEGAAALGLGSHQLVTLASIIQKEAGNREEMPLIASVFHNRLRLRMPLQADPTVIYGIPNFNGNLTRKDLATPTPYNTYRILGLPPGPIANPGEDALRAAAFPPRNAYLYFVARGDGTHAFSTTLREHNKAVQRYQLHR